MFCHRGIGANVDVVGAVLGCFGGLLEPAWGPLGVILGALGGSLGARWGLLRLLLGALRVSLRTPKRFQNHRWIENDDFSKIDDF